MLHTQFQASEASVSKPKLLKWFFFYAQNDHYSSAVDRVMASQPEGREFKFWLRKFIYFSSPELKTLGRVSGCWSTLSNHFSFEAIRLIDTKFHIQVPGVGRLKSCSNGPGHVIT